MLNRILMVKLLDILLAIWNIHSVTNDGLLNLVVLRIQRIFVHSKMVYFRQVIVMVDKALVMTYLMVVLKMVK